MNSRKTFLFFLFLLCAALSGCVLSLQPLFTDKEQIYDPALDGVWQIKDSGRTYTDKGGIFTLRWFPDGKFYFLKTELKDQPNGGFNAVLGIVGTNRFLQLAPQPPKEIHPKSFYGGHFIQAYSFWKVQLEKDTLSLSSLDYEWIERMDKEKKLDLKHEKRGKFIILTASTDELKTFVSKYADDKSAFSDVLSFERKK